MRQTAREVLNEFRWRADRDFARVRIEYADRRQPEGFVVIRGPDVVAVERRYFMTATSRLPFYKILRIRYGGELVFERRVSRRLKG